MCPLVKDGFTRQDWPEGLKKFITKAHELGLDRNISDHLGKADLEKDIKIGMNQKKVKETASLSLLIHDICQEKNVTHILDLGCGQGYLSSVLAYQFGYSVVGWDCDPLQTSGGHQRATRIADLYNRRGKTITGSLEFITNTVKIDNDIDAIFEIVFDQFPQFREKTWLVCGLHCCGNLSPTMINAFCNNKSLPNIAALVNLGCCYQLLTEKGACDFTDDRGRNSFDTRFGFPMSHCLQDTKLGFNARITACQAPKKWGNEAFQKEGEESLRRLYYRSVLERLIKDYNIHLPVVSDYEAISATQSGERAIKKLGVKDCESPLTYTKAALARLAAPNSWETLENASELTDAVIIATFSWHQSSYDDIASIWALRCLFSDVIESLILVDRCIAIRECGLDVDLVAICDPSDSPRNMAIVVKR